MNVQEKKEFSRSRKLLFALISIVFFTGMLVGLGEILTRLFFQAPPHYQKADIHPTLGWQTKPFLQTSYPMKDRAGNLYEVDFRTQQHGFRAFGNPSVQDRKKVFFLGDSFVQSVEVSNDRVFYNLLPDSLSLEVFAYGQAGYGTLQEVLLLETYLDTIRPDIVVLQVCDNDFIDNHYKLELESGYRVGLRRPYLTLDGKIRYTRPLSGVAAFLQPSKFLSLLYDRLRGLSRKAQEGPAILAEQKIAEQRRAYLPYDESVKITAQIAQRLVENLPDSVQLIVFSASPYEPQLSAFRQIFEALEVPFYATPAQRILQAAQSGQVVHSEDGFHWNEAGQQIVAAAVTDMLQRLPKESPEPPE